MTKSTPPKLSIHADFMRKGAHGIHDRRLTIEGSRRMSLVMLHRLTTILRNVKEDVFLHRYVTVSQLYEIL